LQVLEPPFTAHVHLFLRLFRHLFYLIQPPPNSFLRKRATNLAGVDPLAGECVVVGPHFDCTVSLVVEDDFNVVVTNSTDVVGEAQDRTLKGQTLFRE